MRSDSFDAVDHHNETGSIRDRFPSGRRLWYISCAGNCSNLRSGVVVREDRIVLPLKLRKRALTFAHRGHPGIVAMRRNLREKIWWPCMDRDVTDAVQECVGCTAVRKEHPPEPMIRKEMPEGGPANYNKNLTQKNYKQIYTKRHTCDTHTNTHSNIYTHTHAHTQTHTYMHTYTHKHKQIQITHKPVPTGAWCVEKTNALSFCPILYQAFEKELSVIDGIPLRKATEEIKAFGEFYHAFLFSPTANLSSSSSSCPSLAPPHTPRLSALSKVWMCWCVRRPIAVSRRPCFFPP